MQGPLLGKEKLPEMPSHTNTHISGNGSEIPRSHARGDWTLCGNQDGDALRGDPQRYQQGARQMRERDDDAEGRHFTIG